MVESSGIKILIVDDSLVFRHAVADALLGEPGISVIGSVRNGLLAMEFISQKIPDLVTLDMEMPGMDGLETLKAIQAFNQKHKLNPGVSVIMLSAHTKQGAEATIKALEAGALDFVTKPSLSNEQENLDFLKKSLLSRLRHFASSQGQRNTVSDLTRPESELIVPLPSRHYEVNGSAAIRAIVIGVSTGGPKALSEMLPLLSDKVKLPIFIVQHMPATFTQSLAESLNKKCSHTVKEGVAGEQVENNTIYIAPGGQHMLLRSTGRGPVITLNDLPLENGCRPSVDVLFRSVPGVYQNAAIAIILTGMGNDGAKSLGALNRAGISVLAQDEASSIVWGMPGSAVATGFVSEIVSLRELPDKVASLVSLSNTIAKAK